MLASGVPSRSRLDCKREPVGRRRVHACGEAFEVALDLPVGGRALPEIENERLRSERGGGAAVDLEPFERVLHS
jgi:hypothetical protein